MSVELERGLIDLQGLLKLSGVRQTVAQEGQRLGLFCAILSTAGPLQRFLGRLTGRFVVPLIAQQPTPLQIDLGQAGLVIQVLGQGLQFFERLLGFSNAALVEGDLSLPDQQRKPRFEQLLRGRVVARCEQVQLFHAQLHQLPSLFPVVARHGLFQGGQEVAEGLFGLVREGEMAGQSGSMGREIIAADGFDGFSGDPMKRSSCLGRQIRIDGLADQVVAERVSVITSLQEMTIFKRPEGLLK